MEIDYGLVSNGRSEQMRSQTLKIGTVAERQVEDRHEANADDGQTTILFI